MSGDFQFYLPIDISKSEEGEERRIIRGYASTADEDRQGESMVQKGLDISDFVAHGFFNWDHDNSIILGYPFATCKVDNKGFWVEGEVLKGIPIADRVWDTAVALKKSNAPRKPGFSVEGKVLERDGGRITKAKIYNVAITMNPVNTHCSWDAVVKSFNGQSPMGKSLEAGYETDPTQMEGGSVFRKESLEKDLHNLSYLVDDEEKRKQLREQMDAKKSLTHRETVLYLQIAHGLSRADALNIVGKK